MAVDRSEQGLCNKGEHVKVHVTQTPRRGRSTFEAMFEFSEAGDLSLKLMDAPRPSNELSVLTTNSALPA